jgi:putative membrane protein
LDDHVVAVRSGWLWRSVTVAPVAKVQSVTATESPFDRRARMATVGIDTAGGIMNMPRLRIPYLGRETALELAACLSTKAAQTTFRW